MKAHARLGGAFAAALLVLLAAGCAAERPARNAPAVPAPRHPGGQGPGSGTDAVPEPASDFEALPAGARLGLDELLRAADRLNPEIAAARAELGAAAGRTEQARLLPNPALLLEAEEVPVSDLDPSEGKRVIGLRQPFVLGSRRQAAASAGEADERALALRLEATRREVLGDVRIVHAELALVRQAETTHDALLADARRTLAIARTRFEARAVPQAEVLRFEVELRELELGRRRLERDRTALVARLRALLGGTEVPPERIEGWPSPDAAESDVDPGPELDLERLSERILDGNPALAAARAAVETADRRIEQAQAERVPDLQVRLAYGQDETDDDIVEGSLLVPLPVFDRNQGRIREARHLAVRARREADLLQTRLEAELALAFADHAIARQEVLAFRESIVPATALALEQVRQSYGAGGTDLLNVLDAQRSSARARLALLEALRAAAVAQGRLWKLVDLDPSPTAEGGGKPRTEGIR